MYNSDVLNSFSENTRLDLSPDPLPIHFRILLPLFVNCFPFVNEFLLTLHIRVGVAKAPSSSGRRVMADGIMIIAIATATLIPFGR